MHLSEEDKAALAVTQVQVQNPGFAGHQAGDMSIGRQAQYFIEGGLAGAVIAKRHLANTNDSVDVNDITANASGNRDRRDVITAGVTEGGQALFA